MKIYKNTVSDLLWETLCKLMSINNLDEFRLVGGTSLSLLLGHRKSVDIDLFTDATYGSIDFKQIDEIILKSFPYVDFLFEEIETIGKSYFVGKDKENLIKIDMFYSEPFVYPIIEFEGIRLSRIEEIAAMKLQVIGNNGRKKDFWDLHELMEYFSLAEMLDFYQLRYPYEFSHNKIIEKITDFSEAENDFEPICLKQKYWELIKIDIIEKAKKEFS